MDTDKIIAEIEALKVNADIEHDWALDAAISLIRKHTQQPDTMLSDIKMLRATMAWALDDKPPSSDQIYNMVIALEQTAKYEDS